MALVVRPFGNQAVLTIRLNMMRTSGWTTAGSLGKADGNPAAMCTEPSNDRATCSTIWLGDHLPGAGGVAHADAVASASTMSRSVASLLAASALSILVTTASSP
jgi:hypothetical protein